MFLLYAISHSLWSDAIRHQLYALILYRVRSFSAGAGRLMGPGR
jgi:hypothetical protein